MNWKLTKKREIFTITGYISGGIKVKDLPKNLEPDDVISAIYYEEYDASDEHADAYYEYKIYRSRKETDEEYEIRIAKQAEKNRINEEKAKAYRKQDWERLKKEFGD